MFFASFAALKYARSFSPNPPPLNLLKCRDGVRSRSSALTVDLGYAAQPHHSVIRHTLAFR
jgi:hypothetical protein